MINIDQKSNNRLFLFRMTVSTLAYLLLELRTNDSKCRKKNNMGSVVNRQTMDNLTIVVKDLQNSQ